MSTLPPPIRLRADEGLEPGFEPLRSRAVDVITELAGGSWSDHNLADPGITLLETLIWGLTDLHYRTAQRRFEDWPMEAPGWLEAGERHWSGVPLPTGMEELRGLAAVLAGPGSTDTVADDLIEGVSSAIGMSQAVGWVIDQGWGLDIAQAEAAVRLARSRALRRLSMDHGHSVDTALEEAQRTLGPSAALEEVDARATEILRTQPIFDDAWDEELNALYRQHRREALRARIEELAGAIRAGCDTRSDTIALKASLETDEGLSAEEARQALAKHACPAGVMPELWEVDSPLPAGAGAPTPGSTFVWPPHPLQSLTCEPVTADDYARLARTAEGVGRAWAVPGVLAGVSWDGRVVSSDEPTIRPGAITLLVERTSGSSPTPAFLQSVLRRALTLPGPGPEVGPGEEPEVDDPHATMRDDRVNPRRTMCDEVGAALLAECEVTIHGVIHCRLGVDRASIISAALGRIDEFFRTGRPESRPATTTDAGCPSAVDGPWPPAPQPELGWMPGDPIRITELIQVILDDPIPLGVEGLQVSIDGGPFLPTTPGGAAQEVPIGRRCVPVLATSQCLSVRLALGTEC